MVDDTPNPIAFARGIHTNWDLLSLSIEAEIAEADRRVGHQYLPPDVFVDSITIERHFQIASVYARIHRRRSKAFH